MVLDREALGEVIPLKDVLARLKGVPIQTQLQTGDHQ